MEVQNEWDSLFDLDLTFSDDDVIFPTTNDNNNNNLSPLSVDEIEQLLFKDDDKDEEPVNYDGFLDDILLDSPLDEEGEKSGEVVDVSDSAGDRQNGEEKEDGDDRGDDQELDPIAKKRKRQLRNKDAAVRSRERKKMHVKDLEMKSRYFEGECKRLGSLLQWYMAENQALRFSLHSTSTSGSNASMTKQESAVLFLESLLLGSLLWSMGIIAVLPSLVLLLVLHHQSQSRLVTVVEEKHLPSLALRKGRSKTLLVGKRFKGSRSRMRGFLLAINDVLSVF